MSQLMPYTPPWFLRNGVAMTVYTAVWASREWENTTPHPEPPYQEMIFTGAGGVPIFGWVAIPQNAHSTIVGTYGITGSLDNQWFLRLLGRKAFAQGYAVVLFDWRAHGKTAQLSPTLTSDGLYEGEDFVCIAAEAKGLGCPAPFWFTGFSLGGQLALWGVKAAQNLGRGVRESQSCAEVPERVSGGIIPPEICESWGGKDSSPNLSSHSVERTGVQGLGIRENLEAEDIGGAAVICPSLDSVRSLSYLVNDPWGKHLEQGITQELKKLALAIYKAHPGAVELAAIERANSIWGFDQELVIGRLGFPSVEAYYEASSGLHLLPQLEKPTLILYAADDPLFDPAIVPDLQTACDRTPAIDLVLTRYGGHVGYISSQEGQLQAGDPDPWWAWNRILEWCGKKGVEVRNQGSGKSFRVSE